VTCRHVVFHPENRGEEDCTPANSQQTAPNDKSDTGSLPAQMPMSTVESAVGRVGLSYSVFRECLTPINSDAV
jgi:hypothetical protein